MNERLAVWSRSIGGGVAATLGLAIVTGCITSGATQQRPQAPRASQLGSYVPPPFISPGGATKPLEKPTALANIKPGAGPLVLPPPPRVLPAPPKEIKTSHLTYKVKKGDTLSEIAADYKVSVDELADVNSMKKSDVLLVGKLLKLPAGAVAPKAHAVVAKKDDDQAEWHVVEKGDSLSKIAVEHKVKLTKLFDYNKLGPRDIIQVGDKIALNEAAAKNVKQHDAVRTSHSAKKAIPSSGVHIVKPNESWWIIAHQYQGLDSNKLQDLNPGVKTLHPGDTVYLTGNAAKSGSKFHGDQAKGSAPADLPADNKYTVQAGDSLDKISRKFGIAVSRIMADNNLKDYSIFPGNVLILKRDATGESSGPVKDDNSKKLVRNPKGPEPITGVTAPESDSIEGTTMLPHFVDQTSDTLEEIAEMYDSKVKWILQANPKIKSNTDLKQVKEIQVPVRADELNVGGPTKK